MYRARPKGGDGVWYALKRFDMPPIDSEKETNMARREVEKATIMKLQATVANLKNQSFIARLFAVIADPDSKLIGKALVYELCNGDVRGVVKKACDDFKTIPVSLHALYADFLRDRNQKYCSWRRTCYALWTASTAIDWSIAMCAWTTSFE